MGLKGLRISEKYDYISKLDEAPTHEGEGSERRELTVEERERQGATVFELGSLRVDVRTKIADGVMGFRQGEGNQPSSLNMNLSRQNLEALRFGLKGFRNFKDEDGDPIPYKTEKYQFEGKEILVPSLETLS